MNVASDPGAGAALQFQCWLDWMDDAILSDDFATYAAGVALPFLLVTRSDSLMVTAPEDLRTGFDAYVAMLRGQGATALARRAQSVQTVGRDLISGSYETHILAHARPVVPPFRSVAFLRRDSDRWQATAICNAMTNTRWPIDLPRLDQARRDATDSDKGSQQ